MMSRLMTADRTGGASSCAHTAASSADTIAVILDAIILASIIIIAIIAIAVISSLLVVRLAVLAAVLLGVGEAYRRKRTRA